MTDAQETHTGDSKNLVRVGRGAAAFLIGSVVTVVTGLVRVILMTHTLGIEGYGSHRQVHSSHILSLSIDLPVVVEAIDEDARIRAVLPELVEIVGDGLVTIQTVEVIAGRARID